MQRARRMPNVPGAGYVDAQYPTPLPSLCRRLLASPARPSAAVDEQDLCFNKSLDAIAKLMPDVLRALEGVGQAPARQQQGRRAALRSARLVLGLANNARAPRQASADAVVLHIESSQEPSGGRPGSGSSVSASDGAGRGGEVGVGARRTRRPKRSRGDGDDGAACVGRACGDEAVPDSDAESSEVQVQVPEV